MSGPSSPNAEDEVLGGGGSTSPAGKPPCTIDGGSEQPWMTCVFRTAAALEQPVARDCTATLRARLGLSDDTCQLIETALHEAIVNAAVHGNLEVRDSPWQQQLVSEETRHRLRDPKYGDRPVKIRATTLPGRLEIAVSDAGTGFDPETLTAADGRYHGRGIVIIRHVTESVEWADDGRTMIMRFAL